MIDEHGIEYRWETVGRNLDERGQRLFAAAEVRAAGHGGLKVVSRITGLARSMINRGEDDLDGEPLEQGRVRRRAAAANRWRPRTPGSCRRCGASSIRLRAAIRSGR
jgi:hypothetical protein